MKIGTVVLKRYALLALASALGACDSGVIVPPPPPTTITVTPSGLVPLLVGQTVTLVATVQNNANPAVSFLSGTPGVASVEATGLVRALAAGTSTITATSVAEPNARVSVQIIVTPTNSGTATLSVQSITNATGGLLDIGNAAGQINVLLNVDIPIATPVDSLQVLMDNVVACGQSWTQGTGASGISSKSAGAAVLISCSINTAEFNATTGLTRFVNRSYAMQARLRRAGQTLIATAGLTIALRNTSFLQAVLTTSRSTRLSGTTPGPGNLAAGLAWNAGNVSVSMIPVIYEEGGNAGAGGIAQAVVSLTTSGRGVTGNADCQPTGNRATDRTIAAANGGAGDVGANAGITPNCPAASAAQSDSDPSNGFSFTFPESVTMAEGGVRGVEDLIAVAVVGVTNSGQAGPACINPNPTSNPQNPVFGGRPCGNGFAIDAAAGCQLRLDNLAPRIRSLDITPATLGCGAQGCFVSLPATLTANAATVDYGVDSQTNTFSYGGNAAALQALPASFSIINETATTTDYFFAITSIDALGNSSGLRFATDLAGIVSASGTVAPAGATRIQKFGVDIP
jgi:hypothetical protein